ncbi:MAG: exo 1,3/1,4-beta-D-glucan glucohydrolase [Aestuariibacter sp.]
MLKYKKHPLAILICVLTGLTGCSKSTEESSNMNAKTEQQKVADTSQNAKQIWPKLDLAISKDASVEARVVELLDTMTLEQKVAQIIQPEIRDITVEDMREYGFGSYLNGGGAYPNNDKHATVADWVELAETMYQASIDASKDGIAIPTMWGTDAVHGHNNVIGATIFPHNIGLGAANNPELIRQIANATSTEVQATGIDWIFAPTVAAARDDRWGRTYESYSEDPDIIKTYAKAIVEGLQGDAEVGFFGDDKVISTVKHFVGDGGTEKGDDQGDNIADEETLYRIHAQGYVGGLSAGAQTVMASFNSWHGKKIHGSQYLLTEVLKNKMGFDGFVVGDWNGHGQIEGCSNTDCPDAINAGLDVYMVPTDAWKPLYHNLIAQVKSGDIPQSRLNDAVSRVLRVKIRAGLFEKPSPKNRPFAGKTDLIGAAEHRAVARQAVRESLVLLKNNNALLPLAPSQNILVAGDAAHNIGKQSGGWSITWQGTGNTNEDFPGGTSIFDGIKSAAEQAGGSATLSVDGAFTAKPDVAVVVFGEEPYAEGNGDLDNVEYQRGNKTDLALLTSLKDAGIPVVAIFISGRPMWVNPEINASDAFVAAWLPGTEGQGIADVILKNADDSVQYDFTGKLSFSWPATPYQQANRHDEEQPLFNYGYGLTYQDTDVVVATLNEKVAESDTGQLKEQALYNRQAQAPWHFAVEDSSGMQDFNSSILETDLLHVRTIDRRVQEDALKLTWKADSAAKAGLFAAFPEDYLNFLEKGAVLQFDIQRHSRVTSLAVSMACLDTCENSVDISSLVQQQPEGEWQTIQVDLSCFAQQQVNFGKVMSPFALNSQAPTQVSISDISLQLPDAEHQQLSCE